MTVTRSSHWRARHLAIGRKGAHEVDWLFADEEEQTDVMSPRKHNLEQTPSKPISPVSVASTFDVPAMGEIKPLVLPGSWVVVGKGGRPLKNDKMYEEPVTTVAKKKKKKARSRKALPADEEWLVVTLEEAPASSKCLHALERSVAGRKQQSARAMEAKHWASYQRAKQLKRAALSELLAALDLDQTEEQASASGSVPAAPALPTKDNKANRMKDKARRHARSAAAAARCFSHDDDEQEWAVPLSARAVAKEAPALRVARLSGEMARFGSSTTEVSLPGAWMTVGKRGKVISDFPPLKQSDTTDTRKRQASPPAGSSGKQLKANEQPNKPADNKRGKSTKKSKCMLM